MTSRTTRLLAGLTGGVALSLVAAQAGAQAPGEMGSRGQVRVVCEVRTDGALTDCEVLSRAPEDATLDRAALLAASESRVWPAPAQGARPVRIHFPVRFQLEADYDRARATPSPPVVVSPPNTLPATVPPVPQGTDALAWSGLNCVVTAEGELRRCSRDFRRAPPAVLGGMVVHFRPIATAVGPIETLPDQPAAPAVVRERWTALGPGRRGTTYVQDLAPPRAGGRVVWIADLGPADPSGGYAGGYALREYDCPGGRTRLILTGSANEAGLTEWNSTTPSDWYDRSQLQNDVLAQFDLVCPR